MTPMSLQSLMQMRQQMTPLQMTLGSGFGGGVPQSGGMMPAGAPQGAFPASAGFGQGGGMGMGSPQALMAQIFRQQAPLGQMGQARPMVPPTPQVDVMQVVKDLLAKQQQQTQNTPFMGIGTADNPFIYGFRSGE